MSIEEAERPEEAAAAQAGGAAPSAWQTSDYYAAGEVVTGSAAIHGEPSLGRIVHFVNGFDEERAAIVTQVEPDGRVRLCSFRLTGVPEPIADAVPYDAAGGPFTWHWPEF